MRLSVFINLSLVECLAEVLEFWDMQMVFQIKEEYNIILKSESAVINYKNNQ